MLIIFQWKAVWLDWAAITKYYQQGSLKNTLFLTILEASKSKIKVLKDLVLGEDPLPGL